MIDQNILQQISSNLVFLPGVEPVTSLVLQGMIAAFTASYLAKKLYGENIQLAVFTPGGLILVSTMITVDFWSYNGYQAQTYIGNLLISNADLIAFFLGLFVLGSLIEWDFPDKWQTFKKTLSV